MSPMPKKRGDLRLSSRLLVGAVSVLLLAGCCHDDPDEHLVTSVASPSGQWVLEHVEVAYGNRWTRNAPVDEIRLRSVLTPLRRATVVSFTDSGTNASMRWKGEADVEIGYSERVKPATLAAESFGVRTSVVPRPK